MIRENIGFCSKDLAQHNRIMFHEIWISLLTSLCPTLYISPLLSLIVYLVLQIMSYLWNEIQVRKHTPINPWKIKSVPTRLTDGTDFYIKYYVTLFLLLWKYCRNCCIKSVISLDIWTTAIDTRLKGKCPQLLWENYFWC